MKKITIIAFVLFLSTTLSAQDDHRVENVKKDFITKELQLTSQEVDAFFPIYSEYAQKRKDVRRSQREEMRESGESSVDKMLDKEQDMVDLKKEYLEKFRKVLPERKVVQLMEAESKFKLMLMQRLKDKRN
jgi:hypothetical protein